MSAALTPELALAYVHELSADVHAGVVLGAHGELLAGTEALAGPARDLLEAAGDAREVDVATADGTVVAARSRAHAVVVACGGLALPAVVLFDLRTVLDDLDAPEQEAA